MVAFGSYWNETAGIFTPRLHGSAESFWATRTSRRLA